MDESLIVVFIKGHGFCCGRSAGLIIQVRIAAGEGECGLYAGPRVELQRRIMQLLRRNKIGAYRDSCRCVLCICFMLHSFSFSPSRDLHQRNTVVARSFSLLHFLSLSVSTLLLTLFLLHPHTSRAFPFSSFLYILFYILIKCL